METDVATELSLAQRIRDGDRAAEGELADRFYRRVLLMARIRLRHEQTAQDVTQDVMVGVLKGVRQGRLNRHDHLASYVLGTARNLINNTLRSRRSHEAPAAELADPKAAPSEIAEHHEQEELVRRALDDFGPVDRAILGMTLVEGMKPGEIADRLGMKPEVVRKRKSRAIVKVRHRISSRSRNGLQQPHRR